MQDSFNLIFVFIGIFVMLLELFYPILINYNKVAKAILINVLLMHIGIAFMIKLYFFSATMILFNSVAYYFSIFKFNKYASK